MSRLWIGVSVLIAGAALYPFEFAAGGLEAGALGRLLDTCCQAVDRNDALLTALAFAPFGYLGVISLPDGTSPARRAVLVAGLGILFSLALEGAQLFLPARVESLQDVAWSLAGVLFGILLGTLSLRHGRQARDQATETASAPPAESVSIAVNLRRSQAAFLDRLAQEMAVDASAACGQILHVMLPELANAGPAEGDTAEPCSPGLVIDDDTLPPGTATSGPRWVKRRIHLDYPSFRAVRQRADDNGHSISRTIRHLIGEFMVRVEDSALTSAAPAPLAASHAATAPTDAGPTNSGPTNSGPTDSEPADSGPTASDPATAPLPGPVETAAVAAIVPPAAPQPQRAAAASHQRALRHARRVQDARAQASRRGLAIAGFLATLAIAGIFWAFSDSSALRNPVILSAAPWADQDAFILFDHHSHTDFSDGALSVSELSDLARDAGCNALAISDHSDVPQTASVDQLDAFKDQRKRHPGFLLFGGVELNMPSYGKREHATAIVAPSAEDEVLPMLRDAAVVSLGDARAAEDKTTLDLELLKLAGAYLERGDGLVMIYNHPSRQDRKKEENYEDIIRWNAEAPLFIGFAGAPGHQNDKEPGSYRKPFLTTDRWDPVVAEVGGTWDRLLSEGHQLWGAIAGSDFHNHRLDKIPCHFARTHIAAAGFTYEAVLEALRAGTFWADHGRILLQLSLTAEIAGMPAPAYPGSVVSLDGERSLILARVSLQRGPGADGAPLQIEFISNCRTGESETLEVLDLAPEDVVATTAINPAATGADRRSCFLRARVRRPLEDSPDLMAYTNHIRFVLN